MLIKKRKHPVFNIPNYGAKKRTRVKARWRKQRGIDNKKRVKKNFAGAEPTIGYGNRKEVKGLRINNKRPVLINNIDDFKQKVNNIKEKENYLFIISHSIGTKKRLVLIDFAKQNNVKIANKNINKKVVEKLDKKEKDRQINKNKV